MRPWGTVSFADSLAANPERAPKLLARDYKDSGRFPVVDQGQEAIAGWTDDESLVLSKGLPYVVFGDHTRAFKFVDFPFALGADGTQLLRPKPEFNPRFFYYACLALDIPSRGYNRHFGLLKQSQVPRPAKTEQEKIAAVLRKVQKAVEVQDKLVRITRELTAAAMQRLFTRGLRDEPLKETDIGVMPESWSPRPISELCHILSGGTPRKSVAEYWSGDIPWVSGKDLKLPALDDTADHVSAAGVEAGSRIERAGSVLLLVRGMGLAKDLPVAVINRPMAFNQDVKALVPKEKYSGSFLRSAIYAGKHRLLSQIVPSAHGTMTLNLDDVETFAVPCPADALEAKDIADALVALDRKVALHEKRRAVLQDLFQSLLHQLMTARTPVDHLEIDTSEIAAC